MLKIGHRGARGNEPENTLIGFQKALALNVDQIELDIHSSVDGEIMVIHDETIDRTTNGNGYVNSFTRLELQQFQIEGQQYIPTLIEVLNLIDRKCSINIEIKSNGLADKLVGIIEQYVTEKRWEYSDFIVSSFEWDNLEKVRLLNPSIPIAVLTETSIEDALAFAKKIKAQAINPDFQMLSTENVSQMQQTGFQVFPWTVNEIEDIKRIQSYKVDGIISDFPDRL
ncbi:glycerophosphodiester phosphodiesterase family protein [Flavobacterium sp. PL002]|uniref:glycerophosphodiester phosphodiesterase n=1 Tax=Flavobacterium sp. PL002 TaxID=1897058 RepID=UPI00178801EB|nr:glycerophosphodiester phosphodiesterase family protein [Flavobacterium sp. PL002]MBE0393010.1 Glycerophosphoryl diester phosphodiesterase [Flavobacterium sp. PL002]